MLVINDSPYGMRVPIQIDTLHLGMALDLATEQELNNLDKQWRRTWFVKILRSKCAQISEDHPVDLEQIDRKVVLSRKQELEAFVCIVISGILKGPVKTVGISKRVNVVTEPIKSHKLGTGSLCAVSTYTYVKPQRNRRIASRWAFNFTLHLHWGGRLLLMVVNSDFHPTKRLMAVYLLRD